MSADAERLEVLRALQAAADRATDVLAAALDSADEDVALARVADLLGVSAVAARAVLNRQLHSLTRRSRDRIDAEVAQLTEHVHGTDR
jgi:DNA gyrase/topoisomerase IV subunit A